MPIVCSPPYPSLDALTTAPAWIRSVEPPHLHDFRLDVSPQVEVASSISAKKHSDDNALARTIRSTIEAVCNCLVYQASYLNELDAQVGDGDLGTSLALGANNVLNSLDSLDFADVSSTFQQVALLLRQSMGGSSGPLFSMFFLICACCCSNSFNCRVSCSAVGPAKLGKGSARESAIVAATTAGTNFLFKMLSSQKLCFFTLANICVRTTSSPRCRS